MSVVAIIPARGGSKGIPHKNKKLLLGKPLIAYTIEAAKLAKLDKIVVSTDDEEIAEIAVALGVEVVVRPKELAQDNTPTLPVIHHALENINWQGEWVMILQPTSPLREYFHINEALQLIENSKADSLVSVVDVPHNCVPESLMHIEDGFLIHSFDHTAKRRQDKKKFFARNGAAVYITHRSKINSYILGGKILPYQMSKLHSIDIDDQEDWILAECMLRQIRKDL